MYIIGSILWAMDLSIVNYPYCYSKDLSILTYPYCYF